MNFSFKRMVAGLACLVVFLGFGLATTANAAKVTVGAKNFTEQYVVGEMMALLLENAGFDVSKKMGTGSSITRTALTSGQIDLYAEYTGTAWPLYLKHEDIIMEPLKLYESTKAEDLEKNNIVWLDRSKINNTFALGIRKSDAAKFGTSISDLAAYINAHPGEISVGTGSEFNERVDGIPGLMETYDFKLTNKQRKIMDTGLSFEAIDRGQIDVAMVYPTDGKLRKFDLLVLKDDKNFFPAYNLCVTVRKDYLDAHPEIVDILKPVTDLDNETMQELNYKVDVVGLPADMAVEEYLKEKGIL